MAIVNAKITNCKKATIRRMVWDPSRGDTVKELEVGSTIEIDTKQICYDWTDRKYYRVIKPAGWIHDSVIEFDRSKDG